MFHKNVLPAPNAVTSIFPPSNSEHIQTSPRLTLVPSGGGVIPQKSSSALFDLISISAHRCASFFAEAAVLVLVLALLDRFLIRGNLTSGWVIGAFTLSLLLLAASIGTELSARRWLQRH
jgi:hypothetical protein